MKPNHVRLLIMGLAVLAVAGVANCLLLPTPKPSTVTVPRFNKGEFADADMVLLTIECTEVEPAKYSWAMTGMKFQRGVFLGKQTTWKGWERPFGSPDYTYCLFQDRYVIKTNGRMIDLTQGRMFEGLESATVLGMEGSKVICRSGYPPKVVYYTFDLDKWQLKVLDLPGHWRLPGFLSPDQTQSVKDDNYGTINLYSLDGRIKTLGKACYPEMDPRSSHFPTEQQFLWIDNQRILTQTSNGHLAILHLDGSLSPFLTIDHVPLPRRPPRLYRDKSGRIVYECRDNFHIDLKNRKVGPYDWKPLGYGFEGEARNYNPFVKSSWEFKVRHQGMDIGAVECEYLNGVVTAPGYIAVPLLDEKTVMFCKSVVVWNQHTRKWTKVGTDVCEILGWMKL